MSVNISLSHSDTETSLGFLVHEPRPSVFLLLGAFVCSGFSRPEWISIAKSAKLCRSATEKRDPKKHLPLSVTICDRKHANRIP